MKSAEKFSISDTFNLENISKYHNGLDIFAEENVPKNLILKNYAVEVGHLVYIKDAFSETSLHTMKGSLPMCAIPRELLRK